MTLACVGIYGVMAYLVARQNHEIGIRLALGDPRSILWLVLARGAKLTVTGVAIGVVSALLASYIPARRATRVDPMIALRHE